MTESDDAAKMAACDICCEPFNRSTRKPIACGCGATACRECTERYLLDTPNDPLCMSCRRPWTPAFLSERLTKVFIAGPLRRHREDVLFDREKSLLPDTQAAAEAYMARHAYLKKRAEIKNKLKALAPLRPSNYDLAMYITSFPLDERRAIYDQQLARHREYMAVHAELTFLEMGWDYDVLSDPAIHVGTRAYDIYGADTAPAVPAPSPAVPDAAAGPSTSAAGPAAAPAPRAFIRACPADGCRGFLSTAWKCGLCDVYACPDCHEIKPGGRDDPDHRCDPNTLASARLIAQETRPCPKCSAVIYRISGCDHMFCTACKTPFHWRTGEVMETNSNPHLFEWRQQHPSAAADAPDAADDAAICFHEDWLRENVQRYTAHINRVFGTERSGAVQVATDANRALRKSFIDLPQTLSHNRFAAASIIGDRDITEVNHDLRVLYLVGKLDEANFKRRLLLAEKSDRRKREFHDVVVLYNDVTRDIGHRAMAAKTIAAFRGLKTERVTLRDYVRRLFADIARRYNNCQAPQIPLDNWDVQWS